jgi:hypothetical protein
MIMVIYDPILQEDRNIGTEGSHQLLVYTDHVKVLGEHIPQKTHTEPLFRC